jgi:DNA repair exonuclease SbcCD ATPase subunit
MKRLKQVDITDIRSIAQMTMKPGALNVISGDNGEGKTSVLMAIEAVFKGGHRPNLRRNLDQGKVLPGGAPAPARYAKKGEVKFTIDYDGVDVFATRTITEKRSTLDVSRADGMPVPETPQEFVEHLASGFGFDPLSFIEAKPKERLAYLQRALGINFSPDEVVIASGMKPAAAVDLDGLELIRKQVYDTRTKVNTLKTQALATVKRLSASVEADVEANWPAVVKGIEEARDRELRSIAGREMTVMEEAMAARKGIDARFDEAIRLLNVARAKQLRAADVAEAEALKEAGAGQQAVLDKLTAELATAQERARKAAQVEIWRGEVRLAEKDAAAHEAGSVALTAKLDAVDALKKRKLQSLEDRIPGMEPRDGELYVDGLPFDDINTGEQYMRAFQVAALAPGDLGMMVADRVEALGPDNWDSFQNAALASGLQVFATRVTSGPLEVNSIG